jgi:hypothetical protein
VPASVALFGVTARVFMLFSTYAFAFTLLCHSLSYFSLFVVKLLKGVFDYTSS